MKVLLNAHMAALRKLSHPIYRTAFVVVVGPDGSGKSTLTQSMAKILQAAGVPVRRVNFREHIVDSWLRHSRDDAAASAQPHATVTLPVGRALGKALVLYADLVCSALRWSRQCKEGSLVLVERYAYDLVVDPARLGLEGLPMPVRRCLVWLTPKPRCVVLCQAPPDEIAARKPELTVNEIRRQYDMWLRSEVGPRKVRMQPVDSTSPLTHELVQAILSA